MVKVLISVFLFVGIGYGAAAQTRLTPQADGYVYLGGAKMDANFGMSDTLITRYSRRAETTAQTYIRWDLAGQAGSFKTVRFNIYGRTDSASKLVDVYSAFGEWTDGSLKGVLARSHRGLVLLGPFM